MASAIATIAHAAHNVASSLIANAQIQPGAVIPAQEIKEDAPDKTSPLVLTGKNIIVRGLLIFFFVIVAVEELSIWDKLIDRRSGRVHYALQCSHPGVHRVI